MPITANPDRCWILTNPDGSPYCSDSGAPHFDTETEAAAEDAKQREDGNMPLLPTQLDAVCLVVTCDHCGRPFGSDKWEFDHWATAEEAATYINRFAARHAPDRDCFIVVGDEVRCMYCREGRRDPR